jgi:hypothetical protein
MGRGYGQLVAAIYAIVTVEVKFEVHQRGPRMLDNEVRPGVEGSTQCNEDTRRKGDYALPLAMHSRKVAKKSSFVPRDPPHDASYVSSKGTYITASDNMSYNQ